MALAHDIKDPHRLQWLPGLSKPPSGAVFVGTGPKWANPIRKQDIEALVREPDIAAAYRKGGWRLAATVVYRDHIIDEGLDPTELRGKDLVCTCRLTDPCHGRFCWSLPTHTMRHDQALGRYEWRRMDDADPIVSERRAMGASVVLALAVAENGD